MIAGPHHFALTEMTNQMDLMVLMTTTRIVVRRPRRVNTGGILLVADEVTVGCHLHCLTLGLATGMVQTR